MAKGNGEERARHDATLASHAPVWSLTGGDALHLCLAGDCALLGVAKITLIDQGMNHRD